MKALQGYHMADNMKTSKQQKALGIDDIKDTATLSLVTLTHCPVNPEGGHRNAKRSFHNCVSSKRKGNNKRTVKSQRESTLKFSFNCTEGKSA